MPLASIENKKGIKKLIDAGTVSGGMLPKVQACTRGIDAGTLASVAYHHAGAGNDGEAAIAYRRAGEAAAAVFAHRDAVAHYESAIAFGSEEAEVAARLYDRGLSLPCSVGITPEEREAVTAHLVAALAKRPSE